MKRKEIQDDVPPLPTGIADQANPKKLKGSENEKMKIQKDKIKTNHNVIEKQQHDSELRIGDYNIPQPSIAVTSISIQTFFRYKIYSIY